MSNKSERGDGDKIEDINDLIQVFRDLLAEIKPHQQELKEEPADEEEASSGNKDEKLTSNTTSE